MTNTNGYSTLVIASFWHVGIKSWQNMHKPPAEHQRILQPVAACSPASDNCCRLFECMEPNFECMNAYRVANRRSDGKITCRASSCTAEAPTARAAPCIPSSAVYLTANFHSRTERPSVNHTRDLVSGSSQCRKGANSPPAGDSLSTRGPALFV